MVFARNTKISKAKFPCPNTDYKFNTYALKDSLPSMDEKQGLSKGFGVQNYQNEIVILGRSRRTGGLGQGWVTKRCFAKGTDVHTDIWMGRYFSQ